MKQLKTLIVDPNQRKSIVSDCASLVDEEVKNKTGLSGIAVKTAYGLVKAIKPTIIEDSVDGLLDEFIDCLQPYYEQFQQQGNNGTLEKFMSSRQSEVAESMLGITDRRAQRSTNRTMVKAYEKLRPKGKPYVESAVPAVGRLLDRRVTSL